MVPTQCRMILEASSTTSQDRGSVKVMMIGAGVLDRPTFDGLHAAFPSVQVFVCYGMTEGFITMTTPADFALGKFGSVGIPVFGTDMRIIDEDGHELPNGKVGEIVGYGAGLMKGYYKDAEHTDEIIWKGPRGTTYIRTGDAGYLDEDGYLFLSGRFKDMIKSGGYNIFAADIETVFNKHPDVVETAVVGAPHEKWGETPVLLAIMRAGSMTSEDALMSWGNEQLAKYQRVSKVEFRTAFPRGAYDKVLKRVLREPYWGERPSH
jgi:acyl-CoA synthetase (AMP-forming)/AMP-acid ligase II